MSQISLKRLVSQKEVLYLIHTLLSVIDTRISIQAVDGKLLMGDSGLSQSQYPVEVGGEVIG